MSVFPYRWFEIADAPALRRGKTGGFSPIGRSAQWFSIASMQFAIADGAADRAFL
jgi:hypothetical protein